MPKLVGIDLSAITLETSCIQLLKPVLDDAYDRIPIKDAEKDKAIKRRLKAWAHAIGHREGVLFRTRSHIYPTTLARLPWTDALVGPTVRLHDLRAEFIEVAQALADREAAALARISELDTETLAQRVERTPSLFLQWTGEGVVLDVPQNRTEVWRTVHYGNDLFGMLRLNDETTAHDIEVVLPLFNEDRLKKEDVLRFSLPRDETARAAIASVLKEWREADTNAQLQSVLEQLDEIVGAALGLTHDELAQVRADMSSDPFLRRLKPSLPFSREKMRGFRQGLERADRFERLGQRQT